MYISTCFVIVVECQVVMDEKNQLFSVCCYTAAFRSTGGFRFGFGTGRHVRALNPATCYATQQDQRRTITMSSDLTFYQ
jgi:hypothetical protein